jgi:surface polysaccharide O-acyltransferase-like enzyme
MTSYLSEKIKVLSAVSIILVLYIHAGFTLQDTEGMTFIVYAQGMLSKMIGRCAVPLFYMISGYLFFYKVPAGIHSIFEKIKKRIKTLLIPYIIGNVFFIVFYAVIESIPGTRQFMNDSVFLLFKKDWVTILISVFYDMGNGMPQAFQLWFLRDLIILVALSPIWYLLFKYLKWFWIPVVFLLNYFSIEYIPLQSLLWSLFWFSLGGALVNVDISKKCKKQTIILLSLLFLIFCLVQLFYPALPVWEHITIPIILLGIIAIWFMYDTIVPPSFSLQTHAWLAKVCAFTFFIYLFHEASLNIVKKIILHILGGNELGYIVCYFTSPWIFITVAVFIGIGMKKYIPKLYSIAVGGR